MSHVSQSFRRVVSSLRVAPKALIVTGALVAAVAGATLATPSIAEASSGLQYHRGYSVQHGWYCYGWADGWYHCTHHWFRTHTGAIVSTNTLWVPNNLYDPSHPSYSPAPAHRAPAHQAPAHQAPVHKTPAAKPVSHAANPGRTAIINEIRAVFGPYAGQALRVAACESDYNPNARNPTPVGGAHAAGVFQILDSSTWYTTSYRGYSPYNAWANIHAAYQIFHRDGNSWREWACKP